MKTQKNTKSVSRALSTIIAAILLLGSISVLILNPEFDDFDEYINTTMIKIAGGIYPLTKFVRSDYDLQDYRNVN